MSGYRRFVDAVVLGFCLNMARKAALSLWRERRS